MVLYNFQLICTCGRSFKTTVEEILSGSKAMVLRMRLQDHVEDSECHVGLEWEAIQKLPIKAWSADWRKEFKVKKLNRKHEAVMRRIVPLVDPDSVVGPVVASATPGSSTHLVSNTVDRLVEPTLLATLHERIQRVEDLYVGLANHFQNLGDEILMLREMLPPRQGLVPCARPRSRTPRPRR